MKLSNITITHRDGDASFELEINQNGYSALEVDGQNIVFDLNNPKIGFILNDEIVSIETQEHLFEMLVNVYGVIKAVLGVKQSLEP